MNATATVTIQRCSLCTPVQVKVVARDQKRLDLLVRKMRDHPCVHHEIRRADPEPGTACGKAPEYDKEQKDTVIRLLKEGKKQADIGSLLGLSEHQVGRIKRAHFGASYGARPGYEMSQVLDALRFLAEGYSMPVTAKMVGLSRDQVKRIKARNEKGEFGCLTTRSS